jgi:hypothetical protein
MARRLLRTGSTAPPVAPKVRISFESGITALMHKSRHLAVLLALFACGCSHHGTTHASTTASTSEARPIPVTATGRIGPLEVEISDRAAVISFAGRPNAENRGEYLPSYGRFEALGYQCGGRRATDKGGLPSCATVFYINLASGKLEEFYTADRRYSGPGQVHVGLSAAEAQRRLHKRLGKVGCIPTLTFRSRPARFAINFKGFRGSRQNRIEFFVLVSNRHAAGAFDCIDS